MTFSKAGTPLNPVPQSSMTLSDAVVCQPGIAPIIQQVAARILGDGDDKRSEA